MWKCRICWGYPAKDIIRYVSERGYCWFPLREGGVTEELGTGLTEYDGNFVAAHKESVGVILSHGFGPS